LNGVVHLTARIANGVVRRLATLLGLRWAWMPVPRFVQVVERTVSVLRKETGACVIVLGINPTSARVENQLPGTGAAIAAANTALAALCARLDDAVQFVDPASVLGPDASVLVPDGIHFSTDGHQRIAAQLAAMIAVTTRSAGAQRA
jgi:lysophospholipase L1-like esterase